MAIRASARNLPTTAQIEAAGLGIERAWRSLLRQLEPIAGGTALALPNDGIGLERDATPERDREIVALLAFLARPDEDYLDWLRSRCGAAEEYGKLSCGEPENVHTFSNPARLHLTKTFVESEAYLAFTKALPEPELLNSFEGFLSSAPGYSWTGGAFVRRFSDDWDTVWIWFDPENTDEEAFPHFLGFARHDGGWRAAGRLVLDSSPVFEIDEESFLDLATGDAFLTVCAVSREGSRSAAEALLSLSDEQIGALESWLDGKGESVGDPLGFEVLSFIHSCGDSLGDGARGISRLFELVGDVSRFSDLEKLAGELDENPRFTLQSQKTRERRKRQAYLEFQRTIRRGEGLGLWDFAHEHPQLPLGDSLFVLFLGWHHGERLRWVRQTPAGRTVFLAWALEGRGPETVAWLRGFAHPEASAIAEHVIATAREPYASGFLCGIANGPLRRVKEALPEYSCRDVDSPANRPAR